VRAAVTEARATMRVVDVPEPGEPGPGEVVLRPEAVGLCGSDFHYFEGDLGGDDAQLYPRIQGHEAAGVLEAVGSDCPPTLHTGVRVALWPVGSCGACYPCRLGRPNVCASISLIGIHRDGALQERLLVPAAQIFPVGDLDAAVAALIEPVSIAVRAVNRGRIEPGEHVVVFGAGPIGQAVAAAATDRGAEVLVLDPVATRAARAQATGADTLAPGRDGDLLAAAREWAGGDGPAAVFEASGAVEVARAAVELVAPAGRVVVVGLSTHVASLVVGDLAFKEIDMLGVSCCDAEEFADAVSLVTRRRDALEGLVTHEFPLEQAPDAIAYAIEHPAEVMKAVIRLEAP
jgi:threonine dehydrogenase-like Zn-dependent dehydrogenase